MPGTGEIQKRGPTRYRLPLDGGDDEAASDAAVNRLLQAILDLGVTLREFKEGNSLEEVFLKVTGSEGNGS